MFWGYHLSIYETADLTQSDQLVKDVIEQTSQWEQALGFSPQQKDNTLILSGTSASTETEQEKLTVLSLVPLDRVHKSFSAIWEGLPGETLVESTSLKIEKQGV